MKVSSAILSNPTVPVVFAGSVVSSGDYASATRRGIAGSIFGTRLADSALSTGLPLPTSTAITVPVLLRHFVRTRRAGAIFRLRLCQARRSRPQRLEQIFTVLLRGIEQSRRRVCRWLGEDGGCCAWGFE